LKTIPNKEELASLQKSIRARKLPKINDGMSGRHTDIGEFKCFKTSQDFRIEWQRIGGKPKSAFFKELIDFEKNAQDRLDCGYLIADIINKEAVILLHSIPDSKEAMKYTNSYFDMEEAWRHWAIIPTGKYRK